MCKLIGEGALLRRERYDMSIPFFRSMQTQARWEVCGVPVFITNLSSFQGDIPWYYIIVSVCSLLLIFVLLISSPHVHYAMGVFFLFEKTKYM